MSEYLKMADVFTDEVKSDSDYLLNNELGEIANFSGYKNECRYAAHAINSHDALVEQRDELLAALHDAATSLETIQLRSFGDDSYLDDKHSMRAYAGARAAVAREAMKKSKGGAE